MKKFIAYLAALSMAFAPMLAQAQRATPAISQSELDTLFPKAAPGEFGPHAEAPDGLDVTRYISSVGIPSSAAPDPVGAFRFICGPGQVLNDDPVVYPGKPGKSHSHQFYGNVLTNANSTYESQRAAGTTSCGSPLNRSGYWMPALIDRGMVLRPEIVVIYYKREPKSSPFCDPSNRLFVGICVGVPNALRFIFGVDMVSNTIPTGNITFHCYRPDGQLREGSVPGDDMVLAGKNCQVGDTLFLEIEAPSCWDGVNLDTANHRSHMHNTERVNNVVKCPATHPYHMPGFTLKAVYRVNEGWDNSGTWEIGRKTWYMASDIMYGMTPRKPGSTYHTDYFEGWNERVKKAWTDNCIDKLLNCSSNTLGNGWSVDEYRWGDNLPSRLAIPSGIRGPYLGNHIHSGQ